MTRLEVRGALFAEADLAYKEFNDRLANCQTAPSIGVRVPKIREIAKQIIKNGWEGYLEEMEAQCPVEGLYPDQRDTKKTDADKAENMDLGFISMYQEEHMLQGIVAGSAPMSLEERVRHLDQWIPGVLSWGDCDCSVSSFKFMKKDQDFWFCYLSKWLVSQREFEVRVALVALMQYFINEEYIDRVMGIFSRDYRALFSGRKEAGSYEKNSEVPYYIKMAQAWALSVCFVKFRDKTLEAFKGQRMEPWVQNKAIAKCRESYRVSKEDKELLKTWKM